MPLQIRRGTEAERQLLNVPPVEGELIWITDDFKLYIGDGTTLAKNLAPVTGYADANAVNAVGNAFATGTHNNINFTYAAGSISASVDLADYQGEINATAIRGSIFADDSTELVNAVDSLINLNGTVGGHIIPDDTLEFDIGSPAFRFRDLYLSGTSIDLGGAVISSPDGSIVNLPAGSTIGGISISSPVGDLKGSVFADDSTLLIDGISGDANLNNVNVNSISVGSTELLSTTIGGDTALILGNADSPALLVSYLPDLPADAISYIGIADALNLSFKVSNGTLTAPTLIDDEKVLLDIKAYGWTGHNTVGYETGWGAAGSITIETLSGSTINSNDLYIPGSMNFSVNNDNTGSDTTAMVLENNLFLTTCPAEVGGYVQLGSYTSAEKGALTANNGMMLYDSDLGKVQFYQGGTWINLDGTP